MAIVQVPADGALPAGAVVTRTETAIDLSTAISGAAPANKVINTFPAGGVGRLRFRVGAGAGSQNMTITAGDTPGFVRPVTVPIAGPGDYFWPTSRVALALALKLIKTATALGGTSRVEHRVDHAGALLDVRRARRQARARDEAGPVGRRDHRAEAVRVRVVRPERGDRIAVAERLAAVVQFLFRGDGHGREVLPDQSAVWAYSITTARG